MLFEPDVEFAQLILERAGAEDARRLCRSTSPINNERILKDVRASSRSDMTFDHYIEDDNWTALIAAAWYGRPRMVSLLLDEVKKAGTTEVEAGKEVRNLLQLGKRPGINTPAALFLARHRASKFKELLEHASGQRPGPAPTEYLAGFGKHTVTKQMRGRDGRHGTTIRDPTRRCCTTWKHASRR